MRPDYPCPGCGTLSLHRSRTRNFSEKFINTLTLHRIFRCSHCNWRGWISLFQLWGRKAVLQTLAYATVALGGAMLLMRVLNT